MRQLASYALHAQLGVASGSVEVATIVRTVDDWLGSKGTLDAGGDQLVFHDGRFASLTRSTTESSLGRITEAVLTEPTGNGWFRTSVSIAEFTGSLDVAVSLAAASDSLNPLSLDVHCPRLIHTLLALAVAWTYRATHLSSSFP